MKKQRYLWILLGIGLAVSWQKIIQLPEQRFLCFGDISTPVSINATAFYLELREASPFWKRLQSQPRDSATTYFIVPPQTLGIPNLIPRSSSGSLTDYFGVVKHQENKYIFQDQKRNLEGVFDAQTMKLDVSLDIALLMERPRPVTNTPQSRHDLYTQHYPLRFTGDCQSLL
ncbi:MAG: hypothetical protein V4568_00070 [Pseudomonadota bacterium]